MGQDNGLLKPNSIDLIVYDFDGVMTDNRALLFQDGAEAVFVNRADGLGVDYFRRIRIPQVILSTETNPVVMARATKLQIEAITACKDKRIALERYCDEKGYALHRVLYVGNDLNDLDVMKIVGIPVAPADAHPEVKKVAKIVTSARGGEGVVKELSERISRP